MREKESSVIFWIALAALCLLWIWAGFSNIPPATPTEVGGETSATTTVGADSNVPDIWYTQPGQDKG